MKAEGFILLNDEPKQGADNKLVCFVHPKSVSGVLVELCQSRDYPHKTKVMALNIDEQLNLLQFRTKLILPDDLIEYFKSTDKEIDSFNQDMFTFYKFDEFKSVKEEVGDYGGIPDYRNIVNVLTEHENCFVFAEYFIRVCVYAIRLNKDRSNINEVYVICGGNYKIIANSFTEFMEIYKTSPDWGELLI